LLVLGLGLEARFCGRGLGVVWPWPEERAVFSLFGRHFNPGTPSDSDDMNGSNGLPGHYQLSQFQQQ